jgi:hypothetical protein
MILLLAASSALYMDSPSLANRFLDQITDVLCIRPIVGDAIARPSMYALSGSSRGGRSFGAPGRRKFRYGSSSGPLDPV